MHPNHHTDRFRRARALTRLDSLTTGAALAGVVGTLGFGFVAAQATHVSGPSGQVTGGGTANDGSVGAPSQGIPSSDPSQAGASGANPGATQDPSVGGQAAPVNPFAAVQPPVVSSRPGHTTSGGSH